MTRGLARYRGPVTTASAHVSLTPRTDGGSLTSCVPTGTWTTRGTKHDAQTLHRLRRAERRPTLPTASPTREVSTRARPRRCVGSTEQTSAKASAVLHRLRLPDDPQGDHSPQAWQRREQVWSGQRATSTLYAGLATAVAVALALGAHSGWEAPVSPSPAPSARQNVRVGGRMRGGAKGVVTAPPIDLTRYPRTGGQATREVRRRKFDHTARHGAKQPFSCDRSNERSSAAPTPTAYAPRWSAFLEPTARRCWLLRWSR